MAIEKRVVWNETERIFEPVFIDAVLVKGGDVPIPLEVVEPVRLEPEGLIELEREETGTPARARWRVRITDRLLHSNEFYKKAQDPITVTIDVRPVADSAAVAAVVAGPATLSQTCTVRIDLPKPQIHWRGPPFERDDAIVEVEADGEHDFQLTTWVTTFLPRTQEVGPNNTDIEFTHKTELGFSPTLFGPHPDDRPWVVAQPGSTNNRQVSRWLSKASLPDPAHPGLIPPKEFKVMTRVWPRDAIIERRMDEVRWRTEPLLEHGIPFVLTPVKLVVESRRTAPFLANGEPVGAAFQVFRARDHKPPRKGVISWEIKTDTSLGGSVDSSSITLVPADEGRFGFNYIPPKLTYKPNDRYHEELVVYQGAGNTRVEIGTIPLLLRPAIRATVKIRKRGLETDKEGIIDLAPDKSAAELHGVLKLEINNVDPTADLTAAVAYATIDISCGDVAVHGDTKTDDKGKFIWKLPELDEVFVKLPEERTAALDDAAMPTIKLDREASEAIETFEDKLRQFTPEDVLALAGPQRFKTYRLVFGEQLASREESDYPAIIAGCDLLRVAAASVASWQSMHRNAFDRSITDLGNFLSDLVGTIISVKEVGHAVAKVAGEFIEYIMKHGGPLVRYLAEQFALRLRFVGTQLIDAMKGLRTSIPAGMWSMVESTIAMGTHAINGVFGLFGVPDQAAWGPHLLIPLTEGLANLFSFFAETIRTLCHVALYLAFGAMRAVLSTAAGATEWLTRSAAPKTAELIGKLANEEKTWTNFSLDKLGEIGFTKLVETSQAVDAKSYTASGWLKEQFNWWPALVRDALDINYEKARQLQVPTASTLRIDEYNADFRTAGHCNMTLHATHCRVDEIAAAVDLAVLGVEVLLVILGSMASAGVLTAAAYGGACSNIEIGVGSLKSLVRVVQYGASVGWGMVVQTSFHSATVNLMGISPP